MKLSPFFTVLRAHDPRAFFQISGDWKSLVRMHFLYASLSSGLLKALDRPKTVEELRHELDVKRPQLLDALLELGVSLGELERRSGTVQPQGCPCPGSPEGEERCSCGHGPGQRDLLQLRVSRVLPPDEGWGIG